MNIEQIRQNTKENIFIVLTKLGRDYKNDYCDDHAKERANVIERSLYDNCRELSQDNWVEEYSKVDINRLVRCVESRTRTCILKDRKR
jgi:hypothetical protein